MGLLVFALSFLAYLTLMQEVPYGDGIIYLWHSSRNELHSFHLLYLPVMKLFEHACMLAGIGHRGACFAFSAFAAAAGNAFTYALLARIGAERGLAWRLPLALTLLAATAPVTMFYAATVEVQAQHYAWTAFALWAMYRLLARASPWRFAASGLAILCVTASHQSGPLLVPCLALLAWTRFGRDPLVPPEPLARLRAIVVLGTPALLVWVLDAWLRRALFPSLPQPTGNPAVVQLIGLWNEGLRFARWPRFLAEEWLLSAAGVWLVWLRATPRGLRDATGVTLAAGLGVLVYVFFFTWTHVYEHGAYFLPVVPVALLGAATAMRERPLPRWTVPAILALAALQTAIGGYWVRAFARGPHEAAAWAAGAQQALTAADAGAARVVLSDNRAFHNYHLGYDHGHDVVRVPPIVDHFLSVTPAPTDPKRAEFLAKVLTWIDAWLAKAPVVITAELETFLRHRLPELITAIEARYTATPVSAGSFAGRVLRPKG